MKKPIVLHPFLFALYSVLSIYSHNIAEMSFGEVIFPAALSVVFAFILWIICSVIIRNRLKAGIITTIFLFLFFSYGHIWDNLYDFFRQHHLKEELFVVLYFIIFIISGSIIIISKKRFQLSTKYLNIVAIILIAINVIMIVAQSLSHKTYILSKQSLIPQKKVLHYYPDIYYIILDGYGRNDILKEFYQYDNSAFIKFLTKKSFYIARKSTSNYAQTSLSLSCSLNLMYLDNISRKMGEKSFNRKPLRELIRDSRVTKILKTVGYKFVSFATGIAITEIRGADFYLTPYWSFTEFENILINTTPIPFFMEKFSTKSLYDLHRERILYIFEHIASLSHIESPKFVFVHIVAPHPPFIFGRNGEKVKTLKKFSFADGKFIMKRMEYVKNYRNQLIFITKKIKEAIDKLLSNSSDLPIIIIQSDHGPGSILNWSHFNDDVLRERMSILNAYFFPDKKAYKYLYPDITPVNTFRLIFNIYFGTDYKLLEDKNYFSTWRYPYKFFDVTTRLRESSKK